MNDSIPVNIQQDVGNSATSFPLQSATVTLQSASVIPETPLTAGIKDVIDTGDHSLKLSGLDNITHENILSSSAGVPANTYTTDSQVTMDSFTLPNTCSVPLDTNSTITNSNVMLSSVSIAGQSVHGSLQNISLLSQSPIKADATGNLSQEIPVLDTSTFLNINQEDLQSVNSILDSLEIVDSRNSVDGTNMVPPHTVEYHIQQYSVPDTVSVNSQSNMLPVNAQSNMLLVNAQPNMQLVNSQNQYVLQNAPTNRVDQTVPYSQVHLVQTDNPCYVLPTDANSNYVMAKTQATAVRKTNAANAPYFIKRLGKHTRCSVCGGAVKMLDIADEYVWLCVPLPEETEIRCGTYDIDPSSMNTVPQSQTPSENLPEIIKDASKAGNKTYLSVKELVDSRVLSVQALQIGLQKQQYAPRRAPTIVDDYYRKHSVDVDETLWIDLLTIRCVCYQFLSPISSPQFSKSPVFKKSPMFSSPTSRDGKRLKKLYDKVASVNADESLAFLATVATECSQEDSDLSQSETEESCDESMLNKESVKESECIASVTKEIRGTSTLKKQTEVRNQIEIMLKDIAKCLLINYKQETEGLRVSLKFKGEAPQVFPDLLYLVLVT
ncbi:hypothetical protein KUTeg_005263 [Tegillarca granosa]|uniref:Uncharacterized protein n=1 Tax=Tegillarca granosa TaxID=220873 RepID=A0ABQ9FJB2_TEGGR|nr:hypothetical protein KUTeg_005263 [Tegillarca granosa]